MIQLLFEIGADAALRSNSYFLRPLPLVIQSTSGAWMLGNFCLFSFY
jgi:hypothetical protein